MLYIVLIFIKMQWQIFATCATDIEKMYNELETETYSDIIQKYKTNFLHLSGKEINKEIEMRIIKQIFYLILNIIAIMY